MLRWDDYPEPWQAAFTEAWAAYQAGSWPIGAVVVDQSGRVLYRGQNGVLLSRRFLSRTRLAHAEYLVLSQIPTQDIHQAHDYSLYSTLEPCPLCFGALVMSNVRNLYYAARDPHAGSTELADTTAFIRQKAIRIQGPNSRLGPVQAALLADYILCHFQAPSPRVDAIFTCYPQISDLVDYWRKTRRLERATRSAQGFGAIADELAASC